MDIKEHLLWPLGDPDYTTEAVAKQLVHELGQSQGAPLEKQIKEKLEEGLRPFKGCAMAGNLKAATPDGKADPDEETEAASSSGGGLVELRLAVRHEDSVLLDRVLYDTTHPGNAPEAYASLLCAQLGLDLGWYRKLTAEVETVLRRGKEEVSTLGAGAGPEPEGGVGGEEGAAEAAAEWEALWAGIGLGSCPRLTAHDACQHDQLLALGSRAHPAAWPATDPAAAETKTEPSAAAETKPEPSAAGETMRESSAAPDAPDSPLIKPDPSEHDASAAVVLSAEVVAAGPSPELVPEGGTSTDPPAHDS